MFYGLWRHTRCNPDWCMRREPSPLACQLLPRCSRVFAGRFPRRVVDTFGKMVILYHPFDVEVFNGYYIELLQQVQCCFMAKVQALLFDLELLFRQQLDSLTTVLAATLFARQVALCRLQALLGLPQMLWVRNCRSGAERGEVFQADTHLDALIRFWNVGRRTRH